MSDYATAAAIEKVVGDIGDHLASHRASAPPLDIEKYRHDYASYMAERLLFRPEWLHPGMMTMFESLRDNQLTCVVSCHGFGKDFGSIAWAVYMAEVHRFTVICLAPRDLQAIQILGKELRGHFHRAKLPGELFTRAWRLPGDDNAGVMLMSAGTDASKLTGFHAPRVMVILSEAQGLDPEAISAAMSCAVGEHDRVLAVGNPVANTPLQEMARPGSGWNVIQFSAFDHPNIQQQRTVIPGAITQAYVDRVRTQYGVDSAQYAIKILGVFPSAAENALIEPQWIDAAVARWQSAAPGGDHRAPVVIGVDPARLGRDSTYLAVRVGRRIDRLLQLPKADTQQNAANIVATVGKLGYGARPESTVGFDPSFVPRFAQVRVPRFLVDAIGVGAGVVDRLRMMAAQVEEFVASRVPRYGVEQFVNARAEAAWGLRTLLERGEIDLPPDENLRQELLALTWSFTGAEKILLVDKDQLRKILGRSPDVSDAVMIACYGLVVPASHQWRQFEFRMVTP